MTSRKFGHVVSEMGCGTPDGIKRGAFARLVAVLQKRSFLRRETAR